MRDKGACSSSDALRNSEDPVEVVFAAIVPVLELHLALLVVRLAVMRLVLADRFLEAHDHLAQVGDLRR